MSNLILSFLKRWKTTSREEDLNRRWILITGNQINFLYKIYRCSHVRLKTIFNLILLLLKRWKTTSREDDLNRIQLLITRTQLNLLCNSLIELKQFSTFQMQIFFSSCLSMVAQLSLSLAQLSPSLFIIFSTWPRLVVNQKNLTFNICRYHPIFLILTYGRQPPWKAIFSLPNLARLFSLGMLNLRLAQIMPSLFKCILVLGAWPIIFIWSSFPANFPTWHKKVFG